MDDKKIPIGPISHTAMSAMTEKVKQARHNKYLEDSRKRLDQIIKKKMKTTFIGALDSFESNFGYLWGHGLDESELTHEQAEFRVVWENTRTEVLNKGNTQLRGLQTDLANHVVSWNRYTISLPVKDRK